MDFKFNQRFFKKYKMNGIDIIINTFNRLPYLQKCIYSLIASLKNEYRITVIDDMSTDGTQKWLTKMHKQNKIHKLILSKIKLGSAESLNFAINDTQSEWFCFANDDMWFHRGWLTGCCAVVDKYPDCGAISFYDYTNLKIGENAQLTDKKDVYICKATGLGATFMSRGLWNLSGEFKIDRGRKMGFFASNFCKNLSTIKIPRNKLYHTIPNYAIHMDAIACKLNERDYSDEIGYSEFRKTNKK